MRRDAHIGFSGIPIDASDKIDDSLMDSVLPYDMSELKPFQTDYLSGFTADRFDVPGKKLQDPPRVVLPTEVILQDLLAEAIPVPQGISDICIL